MKKATKSFERIGLVANTDKEACRPLVRVAARLIRAGGQQALTESATRELAGLDCPEFPDIATLAHKADLLMVFGGDGTMLRVAREMGGALTPILGINTGALGFLTAVQARELPHALEAIRTGKTFLETRPLIEAAGESRGQPFRLLALNDFVITRGPLPRLIELDVTVNGQVLTRYRADGLIVCSPTGSTAYSLAAGGAVVDPAAEVFTITPICAHTLSNRSVIVSLQSTLQVAVRSPRVETVLTADGQPPLGLGAGDAVTILKSRRRVRLLHLAGYSFFDTLRRKLAWRGTNV